MRNCWSSIHNLWLNHEIKALRSYSFNALQYGCKIFKLKQHIVNGLSTTGSQAGYNQEEHVDKKHPGKSSVTERLPCNVVILESAFCSEVTIVTSMRAAYYRHPPWEILICRNVTSLKQTSPNRDSHSSQS